MNYEWGNEKAVSNLRRHRVDFLDAIGALEDRNGWSRSTPGSSTAKSSCRSSVWRRVPYRGLDTEYPHGVINHAKGQYVVGAIHTQTIEGFWSIFKRGVVGTFHKASAKYLPLYAAEFQFRYNNRNNEDIFGEAISGC